MDSNLHVFLMPQSNAHCSTLEDSLACADVHMNIPIETSVGAIYLVVEEEDTCSRLACCHSANSGDWLMV